jgi:hypothetical protein
LGAGHGRRKCRCSSPAGGFCSERARLLAVAIELLCGLDFQIGGAGQVFACGGTLQSGTRRSKATVAIRAEGSGENE